MSWCIQNLSNLLGQLGKLERFLNKTAGASFQNIGRLTVNGISTGQYYRQIRTDFPNLVEMSFKINNMSKFR